MKRPSHPFRNAACAVLCAAACACTQTTTTIKPVRGITGANPKFFSNFKPGKDKKGKFNGMVMVDKDGNTIDSEFSGALKQFDGEKAFGKKEFGKKAFNTKTFATKEFKRDSFQFGQQRDMTVEQAPMAGQRFEGEDAVADTSQSLYDRNKEIVRSPFASANKSATATEFYPAEKSQAEGDGLLKPPIVEQRGRQEKMSFSDIKELLGH